MLPPVTPFRRALVAFLDWEEETEDPERAESEFRAAMRDFLVPLQAKRGAAVSHVAARLSQQRASSEPTVEITGRVGFDADLLSLLAEGWITLEEPEIEDNGYGGQSVVQIACRPATPDEAARELAAWHAHRKQVAVDAAAQQEARERVEYERLKAKFEGR